MLISDLVMEGLLTAYEMELPDGTPASYREQIFPALLKGYLSVRSLSEAERKNAWEVYTLYHGLWFTRIVYNDDSLDSLVKKGDYEAANRLVKQMLMHTAVSSGSWCGGQRQQCGDSGSGLR